MRDVSVQLNEATRMKQLQVRRILDTPAEEIFDRITRLAAQTLRAPVALLTFVDGRRQWFKSSFGLADPWRTRRETPLSHSFCQYVVSDRRPLVVLDARQHELVRENLAIPELGVIAYLGVPLIDTDGSALGSFAVVESQPRAWTDADVQSMQDFASVVMVEVDLRTEVARRAEAEAQLRQASKLEALGRLASGIAHDFNNLLFVMQGYASLLRERVVDPEGAAELRELDQATERASALTRQLLAFSRKQPMQLQRVSINDTILAMEGMLRRTLGGNVKLELDLADALDLVEVDPSQLEQIVMNLVINARDASPGGRIVVRTRERDAASADGPPRVEMDVQDFGGGIDPECLPHIFEPFYTTKETGTGLGLATVYGIVTQCHGTVVAHSVPGQGTTMHVSFPRVESLAPKEPESAPSPSPPSRRAAQGETILVVDDDPAVRGLLTKVLRRAGYQLIVAGSAAEALRGVEKRADSLRLAILDLNMPGTNGHGLGEKLRARFPAMTILYMSGYAEDDVSHPAVAAGSVRFVAKPIAAKKLIELVAELLK